jgi:hypothetical protein
MSHSERRMGPGICLALQAAAWGLVSQAVMHLRSLWLFGALAPSHVETLSRPNSPQVFQELADLSRNRALMHKPAFETHGTYTSKLPNFLILYSSEYGIDSVWSST